MITRTSARGIVFGGVLIVLGLIFLALQVLGGLFHLDLGHYLWPFFVIVPGLALFTLGLLTRESAGEALVIIGSAISMCGALLFLQNLTGLWASWAYSWALIAPTSIGLGLVVYGTLHGKAEKVRAGISLAAIGLIIFLVGGAFFELIIGISGFGLGQFGWPVLLIGLGVLWLITSVVRKAGDRG